tara:strand:+ start:378817 stop:379176 length:360 start_codon:yes stop_codon:yes gene_type:complete
MRPGDYPTVEQLHTAARNGRLRKFDGVITQVFVNGVDIGSERARAPAEQIKYKFALIGERTQIRQSSPVAPANRKLARTRIIGGQRQDPVVVMVYEGQTRLYVDEDIDPYGCDQEPVEG